jgi:hypothetical protein
MKEDLAKLAAGSRNRDLDEGIEIGGENLPPEEVGPTKCNLSETFGSGCELPTSQVALNSFEISYCCFTARCCNEERAVGICASLEN